jgi:hypothetical protein
MLSFADPRIMVAITFHYRHARLEHLYETVRSICHFPISEVEFHVFTNTGSSEELNSIHEILSEVSETVPSSLGYKRTVNINTVYGLENPQHLTWSHKYIIREKFIKSNFTHFIYSEDDHEISYLNFLYFLRYREALKAYRLIPGFSRIEINTAQMEHYAADAFGHNLIDHKKYVEADELRFVTLDNPYQGMFMLDHELAHEYVASRSFDIEGSKGVYSWEVSERAAMGLTWECAPEGFNVRLAVPVSNNKRLLGMACIRHLPNTYANKADSPLAKVRLKELFR